MAPFFKLSWSPLLTSLPLIRTSVAQLLQNIIGLFSDISTPLLQAFVRTPFETSFDLLFELYIFHILSMLSWPFLSSLCILTSSLAQHVAPFFYICPVIRGVFSSLFMLS